MSETALEFWLAVKNDDKVVTFAYPTEEYYESSCIKYNSEKVRVIEYSAYLALEKQIEALRKALEFYADEKNWSEIPYGDVYSSCIHAADVSEGDGGKRARQALSTQGGEG